MLKTAKRTLRFDQHFLKFLFCKCSDKSYNEHEDDHNGENIREITFDEAFKLHTLARVDFVEVIFPAPALFRRAEKYYRERAERQDNIAYDEVFEVEYRRALAHWLKAAENIEAEAARDRKHKDEYAVYRAGFFSAPAELVFGAGGNFLEHCKHGRKRRE